MIHGTALHYKASVTYFGPFRLRFRHLVEDELGGQLRIAWMAWMNNNAEPAFNMAFCLRMRVFLGLVWSEKEAIRLFAAGVLGCAFLRSQSVFASLVPNSYWFYPASAEGVGSISLRLFGSPGFSGLLVTGGWHLGWAMRQ